ncbi:peptidylprolyl isomerase [bacterium]|nr:peptidylprolyl isomerase [bacterium]
MNKKLKVAVLSLLLVLGCTGCSLNKNGGDIAKINDTVITQKEFNKAFETVTANNMFEQMGVDLKTDPDNVFALMVREKIMDELIVNALLREEMENKNITVSNEELAAAEKEVIERFGDKEQFKEVLKSNNVSYDAFKHDLKEEIKLRKYVDSISMVSVGESEAKKYYDANKDKFSFPTRVRASHILIEANPDKIKATIKSKNKDISDTELEEQMLAQMKERLEKAEKLQQQVKKTPAKFAEIAKQNSQDSVSALRGGDLGFFAKEEMVEPFAAKAFSLVPNTISEVVQTPYGYHIIMVTDRQEAGTLSFEESKADIINYLENQDKIGILQNKVEALRKEAKIEYLKDDYNPETIQKKIKDEASSNPELQKTLNQEEAPLQ